MCRFTIQVLGNTLAFYTRLCVRSVFASLLIKKIEKFGKKIYTRKQDKFSENLAEKRKRDNMVYIRGKYYLGNFPKRVS